MGIDLNKSRLAEILLVEDNGDDAYLLQETFRRARLMVSLTRVGDGVECLRYLRKEGPYANAPRPDLIFLDMNMPNLDGWGVMKAMEADAELSQIPVVIMVTSPDEKEILASYRLASSSWMVKPPDLNHLSRVLREACNQCWFTLIIPEKKPTVV